MKNRRILITAAALVLALAMFAGFLAAAGVETTAAAAPVPQKTGGETTADSPTAGPKTSHRLIVELASPPLAVWADSRAKDSNGRLDINSAPAQSYMAQLQVEQAAFVNALSSVLPDARVSNYINEQGMPKQNSYQIAFNGMAIDPGSTPTKLAVQQLLAIPGVKAVYPDAAHETTLYASLPLINAPALWDQLGGQADAGKGVKLASMDGGLHHEAAMFDGTGWEYPTGWPMSGLGDPQNNNGKIIASRAYFREWDPPAPGDENTWPGVNGTSHGTHTGSTAGGNVVNATFGGADVGQISGVAPGAWLMSYRVFYYSVTADGSFYNAEGLAALEDIIADGADVLNNSWGGGPGSIGGEFDPLDKALINAAQAGVFVSMSNGNAGPGLGTGDHPSPDYINVAASSTTGTYASGRLNVVAPEPITDTLQAMSFATASFGAPISYGTKITYTYLAAANVDAGNFEGCNPFAADAFKGHAAVISRGSCDFSLKVLNAENAGAEFVVIHNHASGGEGLVSMAPGTGADQVTISSVFVGNTNGLNMVAWQTAYPTTSVLELDTIPFQAGNTEDILASFSSRGPGVGNVLKPDIAAPGVNILAQGYGVGVTGEDRHLGFGQVSGTSMAAPHVAGAAALLRQMHPGWTNADIKSALMSTAKYLEVYNHDGSNAQPLDMGAGRLDLAKAGDPGVILSPPSLSFGQMLTGTAKTLAVNVKNITDASETYTITTLYTGSSFTMTTPLAGFSASESVITLAAGESAVVEVTFDPAAGMGYGDNQGYIVMTGNNGHDAHMPAWARVTPPPSADVLIIDNDASGSLGFPTNYRNYYFDALDDLGLTYDYWDADVYYGNPNTLIPAEYLAPYKAIIYFTGDNYFPDGTFTVSTALTFLDMDILTEYANQGGILIAMGQDMTAIIEDSYLLGAVLGAEQLQDSVTGYNSPFAPVEATNAAPENFKDVMLDLSGWSWKSVFLAGTNEEPPVATKNVGEANFGYDMANMALYYDIDLMITDPVTITGGHIHTGTVGTNGPVAFPIFTTPTYVTETLNVSGMVTLNSAQQAKLLSGGYYVNFHTNVNPAGELRGQVSAALNGDGAGNQDYIDELDVFYTPLLRFPGPFNQNNGNVAVAHREQPSLENPGISYLGRSIFTSFGLEGVNDGLGYTSRADLLGHFLDWAMDEPAVSIAVETSYANSTLTSVFEATMTEGVSYRWDFGDGSPYASSTNNVIGHDYEFCGNYTVRVEATNQWGNVVIEETTLPVTQCATHFVFFPAIWSGGSGK